MEQTFVFAGIGRRFLAALVDGILLSTVTSLLAIGLSRTQVPQEFSSGFPMLAFISVLYHTLTIGLTGKTAGKAVLGIRVVQTNGDAPTLGTALIRYVVSIISGLALGLGYIWAFFNPTRQTWHDLAASTYVINS